MQKISSIIGQEGCFYVKFSCLFFFSFSQMVEVGSTGGKSQQHMSWTQIQQMRKKMKRSFQQLPKITKVAEKTAKKDKDVAEKKLQAFLNS